MSQVAGTPLYMAPEQLKPKAQVDARADLYAVGVMLYELLTGEVPLGRFDPVSKLRPDSPPALDAVLDRALARRAEDRIASAPEFRAALATLASTAWRVVDPSTAERSPATEGPVALHAETRSSVATPALDRPLLAASDRAPESVPDSAANRRAGARPPPEFDAKSGRGQAPALHPKQRRAIPDVARGPSPADAIQSPSNPIERSGPRRTSTRSRLLRIVVAGLVAIAVTSAPLVIPSVVRGWWHFYASFRWVSLGDGTVMDRQTGLTWAASDNGSDIDWSSAERHAESLTRGGHSDWRLPTTSELSALYQFASRTNPREMKACGADAPDPPGIRLSCVWLWSSESRGSEAAFVYFYSGGVGWTGQDHSLFHRALPVRSRN